MRIETYLIVTILIIKNPWNMLFMISMPSIEEYKLVWLIKESNGIFTNKYKIKYRA